MSASATEREGVGVGVGVWVWVGVGVGVGVFAYTAPINLIFPTSKRSGRTYVIYHKAYAGCAAGWLHIFLSFSFLDFWIWKYMFSLPASFTIGLICLFSAFVPGVFRYVPIDGRQHRTRTSHLHCLA